MNKQQLVRLSMLADEIASVMEESIEERELFEKLVGHEPKVFDDLGLFFGREVSTSHLECFQ